MSNGEYGFGDEGSYSESKIVEEQYKVYLCRNGIYNKENNEIVFQLNDYAVLNEDFKPEQTQLENNKEKKYRQALVKRKITDNLEILSNMWKTRFVSKCKKK